MNILYNNKGIYLSQRCDPKKEMYNLWQVPGGKVERGESSIQAVLRETQEETGVKLEKNNLTYLFNDPKFNCDVYATKLTSNLELKHTEPEKQGPWKMFTWDEYEIMAQGKRTTPTHTTYIQEILRILLEQPMYSQQDNEIQDALFSEAEVYGEKVNILIDSGAVGCIIAKRYLDKIRKPIESATSIRIIDVTGKRTAPLGLVRQVPIKIRDIETTMDMIVTESQSYNVLLGNVWLKYVNALINYKNNTIRLEHDGKMQVIPVTCTQKMDPTRFVVIDPQGELELEEEDEQNLDNVPFYNAQIQDNVFKVGEREYSEEFMEYCNLKYQGRDKLNHSQGPGKCLCNRKLEENEKCEECDQLEQDWEIYTALSNEEGKEQVNKIHLEENKDVPIGQLDNE